MFCQNCGKEIPNESKFCQYCGESCAKESIEDVKSSKNEKQNGRLFFLIALFLVLLVAFKSCTISSNAPGESKLTEKKSFCPSASEMEESIKLYKAGKIISKFEPELNTVRITPLAEKQLSHNDLQILGYITACYSGYIKGNNLNWSEIYSSKTGKKLAKYSEAYGFKMY